MLRELTTTRSPVTATAILPHGNADRDDLRERLNSIADRADRFLDEIERRGAELYLQGMRQRPAE